MRKLYADRQAVLVEASRRELAGLLEVGPAKAGLHLVGLLPEGEDDREASRRTAAAGVEAPPLSAFRSRPPRAGVLVLGYAAFGRREIEEGIRRLRGALIPPLTEAPSTGLPSRNRSFSELFSIHPKILEFRQ
jgi:GntR family transcriptional regulator/MocR family aminotransferase